jgi:hypothetical protein
MDGSRLAYFSSMRSIILAAVTAGVFACAFAACFAQGGTTMIAIGTMEVGTAPADFEFWRTGQGGPGRWAVVSDATASGGRAIEQESTDQTDFRFPLAIYKPLSAKNVDVVVRFKAVAGKVDQAGGIAVRLTSPDSYYVVRANALEDNVRFYHIIKGRRTQLQGANIKVAPDQWHTLGLKAEGSMFTVTFNGKALFTARDTSIGDAGKVALWTKADSVTRFDQFEIRPLQ